VQMTNPGRSREMQGWQCISLLSPYLYAGLSADLISCTILGSQGTNPTAVTETKEKQQRL